MNKMTIMVLAHPDTVFPVKNEQSDQIIITNEISDTAKPNMVMILIGLIERLVIPLIARAIIFFNG